MKTVATRRRRISRTVMVGAFVALSLTSLYAFRSVFGRPGENAMALIPANALIAGSIDLRPGPAQALMFKNIDDALARNGDKEPMERSLIDLIDQSPAGKQLAPLATRSAAMCLLESPDKKGDYQGVMMMPVTDGDLAADLVKRSGQEEFWKGTKFYRTPGSSMAMMVSGSTLIVSPSNWAMHEIGLVISGAKPALPTRADYVAARAQEPSDANLLAFISPDFMKEQAAKTGKVMMASWGSASIRIEDGGLSIQSHGRMEPSSDSAYAAMYKSAPLRSDLLSVLPNGAYLVAAISQPSNLYDVVNESVGSMKDLKGQMDKGEKQFTDQTGIDIQSDVLPALKGDGIIAAYPSEADGAGADVLAVFDDKNGATPTALADKLQSYVDKEAKQDTTKNGAWLTKVARADADEFRLTDRVSHDFLKAMSTNANDPIRYDVLTGKKTVAWAHVDGAFMIASSQELLDKAIASYEGKGSSLASDKLIAAAADPSDGSQVVEAISLSRIAAGVRATLKLDKMDPQARKQTEQVLSFFDGLTQPISLKAKMTQDGLSSGTFFIPMDYAKLIDLVGGMMNQGKSGDMPHNGA